MMFLIAAFVQNDLAHIIRSTMNELPTALRQNAAARRSADAVKVASSAFGDMTAELEAAFLLEICDLIRQPNMPDLPEPDMHDSAVEYAGST